MSNKLAFRIVAATTIIVLVTILILYLLPKSGTVPPMVTHCPMLDATLNGTCTILLIISYVAIRKKKISIHKRLNVTAFILSAAFLLSYVTYHYFGKETYFPKGNSLRPFYLTVLASHIILSAIVLPMVLLSFYYGLTNQVSKHRKLSRWTLPIWLYVTITGVLVYIMISPYYSFS